MLLKLDLTTQYSIEIKSDPHEILKYLHLGISIPILPEFQKYILGAFNAYKAKVIFLKEKTNTEIFGKKTDEVVGLTLVYDDGKETLFFGFFGVYDHDSEKISILVHALINYGKEHDYRYIRGPVNIPAVIYGWGFMVPGSTKKLFIGCPVNPPIYQNIFFKNGFYIKFEEDRYDVIVVKMNPHTLKGRDGNPRYNFSDYEYRNPKVEETEEVIEDYIRLHVDYMPPSAQISPQNRYNAESHFDFIHTFGMESHMWMVYYKPSNEMVACGYIIPNPFSKDKRNRVDSASFHDWVVHPDHRRAGLAMFMYGETSLLVYKEGLRWGSWPVGSENTANASAAEKMGGKRDRRHLILEREL